MADCGAGGARAFPSRCLGARDQAARGGDILHPREAVDRMDVIAPHEAAARADTAHVAFAEATADAFITCDDRLLRQCRRTSVSLRVMSPIDFCLAEDLR